MKAPWEVLTATVARSTTGAPLSVERMYTRTRRSLAIAVEFTSASGVEKLVCVAPVTQPTGVVALPWVPISASVEALRTSK